MVSVLQNYYLEHTFIVKAFLICTHYSQLEICVQLSCYKTYSFT